MLICKARTDAYGQVLLNPNRISLAPMEIGDRIRRARTNKSLTLEALGRQLGVTRSAVHQWENGRVTNITVVNRIKLSEALDLPIADLLPPEATAGEVTVRDKRHLLLLKMFGSMSEPQQEAYLRLLAVMGATEDGHIPPG